MADRITLLVVTDPICSWCWGMRDAIDTVRRECDPAKLRLDLVLAGINTHSTQPVGDYGRRLIFRIWREVASTTGARFGDSITAGFVYNSVLPCLAVRFASDELGAPAFEFLHRIQQDFFVHGSDVNNTDYLVQRAERSGLDGQRLSHALHDAKLRTRLKFEFEHARQYGTQALPNLLIASATGERRLLAGGYLDAAGIFAALDAQGIAHR